MALSVFLWLSPFYFLVGLQADAALYFQSWLVHFIWCLINGAAGQMVAALVPNLIAAQIMQGLLFMVWFIFAGLLQPLASMPIGCQWVLWSDPVFYALQAFTMPQFETGPSAMKPFTYLLPNGTQTTVPRVQYLRDGYGFYSNYYWQAIGWMVFIFAVIRILAFVAIKKVSHIKR